MQFYWRYSIWKSNTFAYLIRTGVPQEDDRDATRSRRKDGFAKHPAKGTVLKQRARCGPPGYPRAATRNSAATYINPYKLFVKDDHMHRHKRFRHGPRMHRPWHPFGGLFWLLLLAFFFMGGRWWPGILVLIGLSMLFGALFRDELPQRPQDLPPVQMPVRPPAPAAPIVTVAAVSAEPIHSADLLPATCPHCGGPVRSHEVKWTGNQSAACAYCGSALPMKKG